MVRATINSEKHIVQKTLATTALGAIANLIIVEAAVAPSAAQDIRVGAIVKAVWIEFWVTSDDTGQGSFTWSIEKRPGGNTAMTYANSIALNSYANKKNILKSGMGLTAGTGDNPAAFMRELILIPKGKQRFGLTDKLYLNVSGISNGINTCGFMIFKEYF